MTEEQVRARLLRDIGRHRTALAWAQAHEINSQRVSDFLLGRHPPSKKVLDALGLERCVDVSYRAKTNR